MSDDPNEPDKLDKPAEEPLANAGTKHTSTNAIVWGFTILIIFWIIKPFLTSALWWLLLSR